MLEDLKWVVTRVDGKIASVHTDYKGLSRIADIIAKMPVDKVGKVSTEILSMQELKALNESLTLDDLVLYGTDFQKHVWEELFRLGHGEPARIMSYSEFATICGNRRGLRAVAHAVGLNPVAFVIPCHRIVPMACIRDIEEAYNGAVNTIFEGADLYFFNAFDFGEYARGKQLKKDLLALEFAKQ